VSAVTSAHFALWGGGQVQMTIRRGRAIDTRLYESWGAALAALNFATAFNGAPDPTTPPSGVSELDAFAMEVAA
jgi:hypothetical protein